MQKVQLEYESYLLFIILYIKINSFFFFFYILSYVEQKLSVL